jgi:hypothetical protein
VLSSSRITLENNGKIRPEPDRENDFARASGGGNGPEIQRSLATKPLLSLSRTAVRAAICFQSHLVTNPVPRTGEDGIDSQACP